MFSSTVIKIENKTAPSLKLIIIYFVCFFCISNLIITTSLTAQINVNYYIEKAYDNNPVIKLSRNEIKANYVDKKIINSQYSNFLITLTSNYLFSPYFNSNGKIISTTSSQNAIGYDEAVTNGGQYSALLNIEKNLFNDNLIDAYQKAIDAKNEKINDDIKLAKHQIDYEVTAQYLKCLQQFFLYNISTEINKSLEDELKLVQKLVENGLYKQTDYMLLKMEADNQSLYSKQTISNYYNELLLLNKLSGINDTTFKNLDSVNLDYVQKKNESNYLLQYRLDSLNILASQSAFDSKYNPNLIAFFNTGLNAVQIDNIQRKFGLSIGLNFSWILFDGDQKSLNRQKSHISLMAVDINKTSFNNIRENELNISAKQIELNSSMLTGIKSQIATYQNLIKALYSQLTNGQLSVVDYLTTLRNFLELQKIQAATQINLQLSINEYTYWNW